MKLRPLYILAAGIIAACDAGTEESSTRTSVNSELAAVTIPASVINDVDGVVTAGLSATSPNTQQIEASADSNIKGSSLLFAPGSFDLRTEVQIGEGGFSVASSTTLAELGLPDDVFVTSAALPVLVTWTYDEDSFNSYTLTIPAPAEAEGSSLAVLYKINVADSSEFKVGLVPPSKLTEEAGYVTFTASSYGVFQAARLSTEVEEVADVVSDKPLPTQTVVKNTDPPGEFAIATKFSSDRIYGGMTTIAWDLAAGATSYTLKVDNTDPACGSPGKTYDNLTLVSQKIETLEGKNYICVAAVNANGSTDATNNGVTFTADTTAPPTPSGLTSAVSGINVTVSWDAVTDVGEAGFAYYELQIGTAQGNTDRFNGPIPKNTSYEFAGFEEAGTVYYARIRAVDQAENASEWTDYIGPIAEE